MNTIDLVEVRQSWDSAMNGGVIAREVAPSDDTITRSGISGW